MARQQGQQAVAAPMGPTYVKVDADLRADFTTYYTERQAREESRPGVVDTLSRGKLLALELGAPIIEPRRIVSLFVDAAVLPRDRWWFVVEGDGRLRTALEPETRFRARRAYG